MEKVIRGLFRGERKRGGGYLQDIQHSSILKKEKERFIESEKIERDKEEKHRESLNQSSFVTKVVKGWGGGKVS